MGNTSSAPAPRPRRARSKEGGKGGGANAGTLAQVPVARGTAPIVSEWDLVHGPAHACNRMDCMGCCCGRGGGHASLGGGNVLVSGALLPEAALLRLERSSSGSLCTEP
eukprot:scaffold157362_cov28-Tisochrysis_lutea.AAC.1